MERINMLYKIKYLDSRILEVIKEVLEKDYEQTDEVVMYERLIDMLIRKNILEEDEEIAMIPAEGIYDYIKDIFGIVRTNNEEKLNIIDIYDYFSLFSNDELETIIELCYDLIDPVYDDIINTCNYILVERNVYDHQDEVYAVDYEYLNESIDVFKGLYQKKLIRK